MIIALQLVGIVIELKVYYLWISLNYGYKKSTKITMPPLSIKSGQVYDRLTVIHRVKNKIKGRPIFKCHCKCGRNIDVSAQKLRSGNTRSCGCLLQEHWERCRIWAPIMSKTFNTKDAIDVALNLIIDTYKRGARQRNISFKLIREDIKYLITSNCFYCGSIPSMKIQSTRPLGLYSGIDRKINNIGYTKSNCVPCCSQCNRAKCSMDAPDFLAWTYRAHSHLFS